MDAPSQPELWELSGSHWTLPIIAEVHGDTALVTVPEIPFLKQQRAVLENALSQLATGGTETERAIPTMILREHARKSMQPDAESVVAWNRMPSPTVNLPNDEGVDEFVADWLISTGFGISKTSATTIYVSLVTHMLHWLVNRRRPVNLMFALIEPFQYRKNWKEIILGKHWLKTRCVDRTEMTNEVYMDFHEITPEELMTNDILAFDEGVCRWSLECTPSAWFHKHSNQLERNRLKRLRPKQYLAAVRRTMEGHVERAITTFKKYIRELAFKVVEIPEITPENLACADKWKRVKRPCRAFVVPAHVQFDSVETGDEGDAPATDGELP